MSPTWRPRSCINLYMQVKTPSPAAAAPRGCTHLKLRQAGRLVTRHYEERFRSSALNITQYSLLSHVVRLAPVGAGELAAAMKLDASTLTRNLQPLVEQGWVVVRPGTDARARIVEATPEGQALRATAQRDWQRAQQALNRLLGSERVAALHTLLDECIALLEQDTTETNHE